MTRERVTGPILVTGAAGKTGRAVLAALVAAGTRTRGLVRDLEQSAALAELGVEEIVAGDLTEPADMARAAVGAAAIYHICPNVHPQELEIGRVAIAAAREAGVDRFVFHSVLHPQIEAMPHHWAKLRVEERLLASPLEFTILRPAPYIQNLRSQWSSITVEGVYRVPYRLQTRFAMVDLGDVATAAARVLTEPGHGAATYDLCGPDLLDQRQIGKVLAERLGRQVRVETKTAASWAEQAAAAGMGPYQVETLVKMFSYYERYGMPGGTAVLEWLLGRPATGLADCVDRWRQS